MAKKMHQCDICGTSHDTIKAAEECSLSPDCHQRARPEREILDFEPVQAWARRVAKRYREEGRRAVQVKERTIRCDGDYKIVWVVTAEVEAT